MTRGAEPRRVTPSRSREICACLPQLPGPHIPPPGNAPSQSTKAERGGGRRPGILDSLPGSRWGAASLGHPARGVNCSVSACSGGPRSFQRSGSWERLQTTWKGETKARLHPAAHRTTPRARDVSGRRSPEPKWGAGRADPRRHRGYLRGHISASSPGTALGQGFGWNPGPGNDLQTLRDSEQAQGPSPYKTFGGIYRSYQVVLRRLGRLPAVIAQAAGGPEQGPEDVMLLRLHGALTARFPLTPPGPSSGAQGSAGLPWEWSPDQAYTHGS